MTRTAVGWLAMSMALSGCLSGDDDGTSGDDDDVVDSGVGKRLRDRCDERSALRRQQERLGGTHPCGVSRGENHAWRHAASYVK